MFWGRRKIHRISAQKMSVFEQRWCQESVEDTLARVFRKHKRIALDVGCGRGESTLFWAQSDPRWHVVACDVFLNGLVHLGQAVEELNLNNVTIVCEDVMDILSHIPDCCVQQVSCFFPDPWPKKRHRKRRLLIQPGFLAHVERMMSVGGVFLWKTDIADYAEHALPLIAQTSLKQECAPTLSCETSYERKARMAQRAVCAYAFRKPE